MTGVQTCALPIWQDGGSSGQEVKEEERGNPDHTRKLCNGLNDSAVSQEEDQTDKKSKNKSEKGKCKKYKFTCKICDKSVTETRLLHHSKRHVNNNVYTCPSCHETFSSRKDFIPRTKVHLRAPAKKKKNKKKKIEIEKLMDDDDDDDDNGSVIGFQARNYYQIIKRPIDLSVIRKKLNKGNTLHYFTFEQFVDDIMLMFRNCATFNYVSQNYGIRIISFILTYLKILNIKNQDETHIYKFDILNMLQRQISTYICLIM